MSSSTDAITPGININGFWRRRFGADPNTVGKTLSLDGRGELARGSAACRNFTTAGLKCGRLPHSVRLKRTRATIITLVSKARPKPRVSQEQAQAEMETIAGRLELRCE